MMVVPAIRKRRRVSLINRTPLRGSLNPVGFIDLERGYRTYVRGRESQDMWPITALLAAGGIWMVVGLLAGIGGRMLI